MSKKPWFPNQGVKTFSNNPEFAALADKLKAETKRKDDASALIKKILQDRREKAKATAALPALDLRKKFKLPKVEA